jgi:hypothetical protein
LDSIQVLKLSNFPTSIYLYHFQAGTRKTEREVQENIRGSVEGNIIECELGKLLIEGALHTERNMLGFHGSFAEKELPEAFKHNKPLSSTRSVYPLHAGFYIG